MEFKKDEVIQDLNSYLRINSWFNNVNVMTDVAFQDFFLQHYHLNFDEKVRLTYFQLLERSKEEIITFEDVMNEMCLKHNVVNGKAAGILIHTRNPYAPRCDDYVLKDLGVKIPDDNVESWIKGYKDLLNKFEKGIEDESTKYIVKVFDKDFPEYINIPITKKIDEVLWSLKDLTIMDLYQEIIMMTNKN